MNQVRDKQWNLGSVRPGSGPVKDQIQEILLHIEETHSVLKHGMNPDEAVDITKRVQDLYTDAFHMDEYIICLLSVDVMDEEAQDLSARSTQLQAKMDTLLLGYSQCLAHMVDEDWEAFIGRREVAGSERFLKQQRRKVKDQLAPEMEKLIHALSVDGFAGWEDHYDQEYARLKVPVTDNGKTEYISFDMAYIRGMLSTDRETRMEMGEAISKVCRENEDRFASIFNHFAGFRNELYRLRGWTNPLKEMFEQNRINERSVNTMMETLHQHKSLLHRFFERKAKLIQMEKLSWYDIYAPTFTSKTTLTYEETADIVIGQFRRFSEKLGQFAQKAFDEGWIDAEPGDSKQHGAFCASFPNAKESRVMLSFTGNYNDVVTIAHELGHAYHNSLLHEQPGFSHKVGTGLAETASTFAENLVLDAAIDRAETEEDRLSLLEMKITNGLKYTTFIPAKFEFEAAFYKKRLNGKLSAGDIVQLMEETERDWFHDSLNEVFTHNWMTIPHFFSTEKAFYNLPYTIGYLFSNGVYSLYQQDKETFPDRYDQLLTQSGNHSMEELSIEFLQEELGTDFWEAAVRPLKEAVEMYLEETEKYR
ncbi:M3 family oligoendopeptidase [Rossellomorea vietnamensis]|uniref:M3 family oligoendopeptidase n=1 Tax=Rossellomorea vietnamensis TaxID=218284 RepID=UPI001E5B046F|nr:M3 family oligoendopeptidase [Rossellomorea vietnamensis]MCC5803625.1 M3 family oligoendopeptidase [Rossellomorea vietnamensis]